MQKVRIVSPILVNGTPKGVKVDAEGILIEEHPVDGLLNLVYGITSEAVVAFPEDSVELSDRTLLTGKEIMEDIENKFGVEAMKAKLPEGYFMTFVINHEYELID